jgi:hypothetical protein
VNFIQRDDLQDYEELEDDLNNLSNDDVEPHLTKQDYDKTLYMESMFNHDENIKNLGDSTYNVIADSIIIELHHKYDLRQREKSSTNIPPIFFLSRNKENEAVVAKQSTEMQDA